MPLLRVEHLKKYYPAPSPLFGPKRFVRALDDVSFELNEGETLGLVGESGCGKSTLARQLIRLENPTDGHIYLDDIDLGSLHGGKLRKMRGSFQMIFQDPYASLNPRMSVYSALEEALKLHSELDEPGRAERIAELLRQHAVHLIGNSLGHRGGSGVIQINHNGFLSIFRRSGIVIPGRIKYNGVLFW